MILNLVPHDCHAFQWQVTPAHLAIQIGCFGGRAKFQTEHAVATSKWQQLLHVGVGIEVDGICQIFSLHRIFCGFIHILGPCLGSKHDEVGRMLTDDRYDPLMIRLDRLAPVLSDGLVVDLEDDVRDISVLLRSFPEELSSLFFMVFRAVVVPIDDHLKACREKDG